MEKINITIIGAGVVGLAVARELSKDYKNIFIIEKNISFGMETSSRNSEVIHAGIYYPKDSLKTRTCIEGRELLYNFCVENKIAHKKIGKLIVAKDYKELKDLEVLYQQGISNGVKDLKWISKKELKEFEPNVEGESAIYSPSTGILDTHSFMQRLLEEFKDNQGDVVYLTEVIGIDKERGLFKINVQEKNKTNFVFSTRIVINCAGLNSERIAYLAGIEDNDYKLKYCKGTYFRVNPRKAKFIKRLIYPVPQTKERGLGIHATLDLSGSLRLGPDDEYVDKIDYNVDVSKRNVFYERIKDILTFIEAEDLSPDIAGIRPKLQGPNEEFRDFLIKEESERSLSGLINLIGIESPGFTASLSIARIVKDIVDRIY